jgi:hypothetical protein
VGAASRRDIRKTRVFGLAFKLMGRESIFACGHINRSVPCGPLFKIQTASVDNPWRLAVNPKYGAAVITRGEQIRYGLPQKRFFSDFSYHLWLTVSFRELTDAR